MNSLVGSFLPKAERPFGDYELITKLATGGMAEIFLARKRMPKIGGGPKPELVVIKRVLPHLLDESRFIAMFRDEARLASRILHPNVCRVIDSGRVSHTYFIAMEYLHGVPLSRCMLRSARTKEALSIELVVGVLIQCCTGLHHAHELTSSDGRALDVVHRDVSPPNIFVTVDGLAKMLDFGVAKARGASQKTRTGTVKGKNSYMSPEQILGREVDRRSDVFSLGIVLWEALTSRRLFSRDTDFLTFTAITKADFEDVRDIRPEVSEALAAVVRKALALDRDDRYATAQELSEALAEACEDYASEEAIGLYLRERFSKDLVPIDRLVATMSSDLEALADTIEATPPPQDAPALKLHAPKKPAGVTATTEAEAPLLAGADVSEEQVPVTKTEDLVLAQSKERKRLLAAVVIAVSVTALVAVLLLGGSDSGTSAKPENPSDEVMPATLALVADASVPLPVTVDAGIPDAAAAQVKPEVDLRPAYLTVDSSPYATIYVDGKKVGVTPIFKFKLKPGPHKLKAVSATGAKQRKRLNLKPGRTKNLGRLKW